MTAKPSSGNSYALLSAWEEKSLIKLTITQQGKPVQDSSLQLPGNPGAITFNSLQSHAYVALRDILSVAVIRLAAAEEPCIQAIVPVGGNPAHLSIDGSGKWLVCSCFADNRVSVHAITENGSIIASPQQVLSYPEKTSPHFLRFDKTSQHALLMCMHGDAIRMFRFDASTGMLAPCDQALLATTDQTGPRHFAFHPFLDYLYVVNEKANSVTQYHYLPLSGAIVPLATTPTLPADFTQTSTAADIHLTADGKFLYTSNRGHDSIACFACDAATGALSPIDIVATEAKPRSFGLHGPTKTLHVAGENSGALASYTVRDNGQLELINRLPLAAKLSWIEIASTKDA